MYKNFLVAYDGSDGSKIALLSGIELAKHTDAKLEAIWIKSKLPHYPETVSEISEEQTAANSFLDVLREELKEYERQFGVKIGFYAVAGNPSKMIVSYAKEKQFDLIVIGNQGHSSLWGASLGHTADRVSEYAHCSVLIVRKDK